MGTYAQKLSWAVTRGWNPKGNGELDICSLQEYRWLVSPVAQCLLRAVYYKTVSNLMGLLTYVITFLSGDTDPHLWK